jgi:hypothetical protein
LTVTGFWQTIENSIIIRGGVPFHQSGNSSKQKSIKAAIHRSGNSSKPQFIEAAIHRMA